MKETNKERIKRLKRESRTYETWSENLFKEAKKKMARMQEAKTKEETGELTREALKDLQEAKDRLEVAYEIACLTRKLEIEEENEK